MTHLVDHVRETWPGVPVWMRKLHRVGPVGGASCEWLFRPGRLIEVRWAKGKVGSVRTVDPEGLAVATGP